MVRRSGRGCFARLLILLIIATVGAILLAPYVPLNRFKPEVESALSTQLGRKVTVGNMHLSLSRGPALVIEDLTAQEDPAFASGNTIEAGKVTLGLAIGPLITNRQTVVRSLVLDSAHVTFNRDSRGAWSWSTLGNPAGRSALIQPGPARDWSRALIARTIAINETGDAGLREINPRSESMMTLMWVLLTPDQMGTLQSIDLRHASVTFVEGGPDKPKQTMFDGIDMSAALSPARDEPEPLTHAVGMLRAASEKTETTELLNADLPFDLKAGVADVGGYTVSGTVGPGSLQTAAFAVQDFQSSVTVNANIARFDEIQANLYEGQLRGGVQLDLASPRPRFAVEGKLNNVNIDQSIGGLFGITGAVTGHITGDLKLIGLMAELPQSFPSLSGDGQLSSEDLFLSNINLGEQVARRLGVTAIGNMAPGTNVGHIEGQFRISGGSVTVQNLHVKQLDGLGDAATDRGTINVGFSGSRPNIQLDFPTTVTLSQEAEATTRQASPLLGIAASLLGQSNQLSVPIHITGDLLSPQVLVDLPRILRSLGQP